VPQSTAKFTKHQRQSYMVGALSRFNLNFERLTPKAKEIAELLGLRPLAVSPFANTLAQLIECVHNAEDSITLIEELLGEGIRLERPEIEAKAGEAVGVVEAPRGILFHHYAYDEKGRCIAADLVTPTNQNHQNIQKDFEAFVPLLLTNGKSKEEIGHALEMLVRAYDPCISCSTHYLKIKFIK